MPTDIDRQIQRSADLLNRVSARQLRKRTRSALRRVRRAGKYAAISITAILVAALVVAMLHPIGLTGVLIVAMAIPLAFLLSVLLSGERGVFRENLTTLDIVSLPAATERWLDSQRRALPARAMPILDQIGQRLDDLTPQLQRLPPDEPAAREVRALLADHLPQLVTGYQSIPRDLRGVERNGRVPDRQLVESLSLIEREIGEMTEVLARGDLDRLAAHGRYLEIKYHDTPDIGRG